jgi:hypothetical protein
MPITQGIGENTETRKNNPNQNNSRLKKLRFHNGCNRLT